VSGPLAVLLVGIAQALLWLPVVGALWYVGQRLIARWRRAHCDFCGEPFASPEALVPRIVGETAYIFHAKCNPKHTHTRGVSTDGSITREAADGGRSGESGGESCSGTADAARDGTDAAGRISSEV